MKRALTILAMAIAILAAFAAWVALRPHHTPVGQPPLAKVESAATVREAFNQDVASVRLILLLSPT
jgi:hypothetical protein